MPKMIKTRSGKMIQLPSAEEDAAITAAAMTDANAMPYTDTEWEVAKSKIRRGRPLAAVTKERITIRLSQEVVQTFRASGEGWQTRVDSALKDWLKSHTPA
jgi:uncharacterized protein (DUF4415 family)